MCPMLRCRVENADCADKVVMLLNTVLESLVLGVLDPKVAQFEDMLKCLQVPMVLVFVLCTAFVPDLFHDLKKIL